MARPKLKKKYPDESRVGTFNFSNAPECAGAGGLENPRVTATPSGLTIGAPTISDDITDLVRFQVSGGNPGVVYLIKCEVDTHLGATIERFGRLFIVDPTTLS